MTTTNEALDMILQRDIAAIHADIDLFLDSDMLDSDDISMISERALLLAESFEFLQTWQRG